MEIIRFPGNFKQPPKVVATQENKLSVGGPLRFSCDCGTTAEVNLTNVIFRHLDFYCSHCGTHYKVTNPAFVRPLPKAPPKK